MTIPFTKAHGAGNDFLLSWHDHVHAGDLPAMARAICDRHRGIGADGWILINGFAIRLFNADGSEAEISGNGTRCAAAFLLERGLRTEQLPCLPSVELVRCVPSAHGACAVQLIKEGERDY